MGGPEQNIEAYLKVEVEKLGGMCIKIKSSGVRGIPDRLVILNGMTVLVELKSKDGKLSIHQRQRFSEIHSSGGFVFMVNSKGKVDEFIALLTEPEPEEPKIVLLNS